MNITKHIMMYKGVYSIELNKGRKTDFHKKYYVMDGIGIVYFETQQECRNYITVKSAKLKSLYEYSKTLYLSLSDIYVKKLISFRLSESISYYVARCLKDCLDCFQYMTKQIFRQYMLGKLRVIYNTLLQISKALKATLLTYRIERELSFFDRSTYPVYLGSSKKTTTNTKVNLYVFKLKCTPPT